MHQIGRVFALVAIAGLLGTAGGAVAKPRHHHPVTITREVDAASPTIYRAAVTNQSLHIHYGPVHKPHRQHRR